MRSPRITAKVSTSNAAYLVGDTIAVKEFASLLSTATLPMDLSLLHCHLCHYHLAGIRKLLSDNLVTDLKLNSKADPDPVCKACKAGKIHTNPFPFSSTGATRPLQPIQSNVHGVWVIQKSGRGQELRRAGMIHGKDEEVEDKGGEKGGVKYLEL